MFCAAVFAITMFAIRARTKSENQSGSNPNQVGGLPKEENPLDGGNPTEYPDPGSLTVYNSYDS